MQYCRLHGIRKRSTFIIKKQSVDDFQAKRRPDNHHDQKQTKPPLNLVTVVIFLGFPIAAMILVPLWGIYKGYDAFQWLWALAFLYLNGLSITGGYHRLWAHKSYRRQPCAQVVLFVLGSGGTAK